MTSVEILREIERLPFPEQSRSYGLVTREAHAPSPASSASTQLATAVRALMADYQSDPELTAFTALDSEDFHAAGRGLAD